MPMQPKLLRGMLKYPIAFFLLFLTSCENAKAPVAQPKPVKIVNPNPVDSILGDKILNGDTAAIRKNNFEKLLDLKRADFSLPSELYNVTMSYPGYCIVSQKRNYLDARTFSAILSFTRDSVSSYYILNDFGITDLRKVKSGWILLCSDWQNANMFWKRDYIAKVIFLSPEFKEVWSYSPLNVNCHIDAGKIIQTADNFSFSMHRITASHMCYEIIRVTLTEKGNFVSAVQTGNLNSNSDVPPEELDKIFHHNKKRR